MIDLDAWREILAAYRDATAAVDKAFAGPPADLGALAALLRSRLDRLRKLLVGGHDAVLAPIAFLLDEQILAQLATTELEVTWPLLGRTHGDTDFGGDVFFAGASRLCGEAEPLSLVIQAYLFCLDEGFVGRYADDPRGLAECRRALFKKLSLVPPPGAPAAPTALPVAPRPAWQFVAAAVAGVVLWLLVLWALGSRL